jgi:phytanoyl-CoA hydroxylase
MYQPIKLGETSAIVDEKGYDIDVGEDHPYDEGLYTVGEIAEKIHGLESITSRHFDFFKENGYLAVGNVFSEKEVCDAIDGFRYLATGGNPDYKGASFERAVKGKVDSLSGDARMDALRKLSWFVDHDSRLHAMAFKPEVIGILKKMLGGGEPQLFQDMALSKPPGGGREKPWHQDHAYFNFPLDARIVGMWIALDPATVDNGCMHILPGKHREPVVHFKRRDWQICDTEILGQSATAVPLQPGGVLFFDGKLPHGTPENKTADRRRALQFHYYPDGTEKWRNADRMAVFGAEGKDVTC